MAVKKAAKTVARVQQNLRTPPPPPIRSNPPIAAQPVQRAAPAPVVARPAPAPIMRAPAPVVTPRPQPQPQTRPAPQPQPVARAQPRTVTPAPQPRPQPKPTPAPAPIQRPPATTGGRALGPTPLPPPQARPLPTPPGAVTREIPVIRDLPGQLSGELGLRFAEIGPGIDQPVNRGMPGPTPSTNGLTEYVFALKDPATKAALISEMAQQGQAPSNMRSDWENLINFNLTPEQYARYKADTRFDDVAIPLANMPDFLGLHQPGQTPPPMVMQPVAQTPDYFARMQTGGMVPRHRVVDADTLQPLPGPQVQPPQMTAQASLDPLASQMSQYLGIAQNFNK